MGYQNVEAYITVNIDTDGNQCHGIDDQGGQNTSTFEYFYIADTCPESDTLTVYCGGENCSGQQSISIPYNCGDSPSNCQNYTDCPNTYYDSMSLNCVCDADPEAANDEERFENLGGCGDYVGCPQITRTHVDACNKSWSGTCGITCADDEFTECLDSNDTTGGTCTCTYPCPTNCSSGYSCDYYEGPGGAGSCNNTNNNNGDADGIGDCGTCPDNCYQCSTGTQCCDFRDSTPIQFSLSPDFSNNNVVELGDDQIQETQIAYRRGLDSNGELYFGDMSIRIKKRSTGETWPLASWSVAETEDCSWTYITTAEVPNEDGTPASLSEGSSARFYWNPEKFFANALGNAWNVISDCPATNCNQFRFEISTSNSNSDYYTTTKNSQWFSIVDDERPGCTDPLANGIDGVGVYDDVASYDNGSCRYSGCFDENAATYSCNTDQLDNASPNLEFSYACRNIIAPVENAPEGNDGTIYNTTSTYVSDDGTCEFYPVAHVSHTPASLNEGDNITISAGGSLNDDSGDYAYDGGDLSYSWSITDTDENDYSSVIVDSHELNFQVPIMTGTTQGGGGIISVDLTVSNDDWSDSLTSTYQIEVGDVDIIGTQLSSFLPIYIPGGDEYTLIGCYLPPNQGQGYSMADLLDSSFFIENPSETENPTLNTYMTGDLAYIILGGYDDVVEERGFYNYISGVGWIGPNIALKPGMGIKLQTENAGWFRWTLPE